MPANTDNRDSLSLVREFNEAFQVATPSRPGFPEPASSELGKNLMLEELCEFEIAVAENDLVAVFDALTDMQYVLDQLYLRFGLGELKQAGFEEVHRSNMSKLGEDGKPIFRADGKVLKGPNYRPPNLAKILHAQTSHERAA